jgi:hypothetical protein
MTKQYQQGLLGLTLFWLLAVGMGMGVVWRHALSAGLPGSPPTQWPTGSQIQRAPGRATLIMLAHPHCPCTRASLGELALLMARCQGRVTTTVLFVKPDDASDGWEKTDLWDQAALIPGVKVLRDNKGVEARRFRSLTSGQTLLYDVAGTLLFSGGITGARGHAGDNDGRSTIVALLTGGMADRAETPVFGCSLQGPNSNSETEVCTKEQ